MNVTGCICHAGDEAAVNVFLELMMSSATSKHSRNLRGKETIFDESGKEIGAVLRVDMKIRTEAGAEEVHLDLYTVAKRVKKDEFIAKRDLVKDQLVYVAVMSELKEWFDVEGPELMKKEYVLVAPPNKKIGRLSLFRNAFIVNDLPPKSLRPAVAEAARYRALAEVLAEHIAKISRPKQTQEKTHETHPL